MKPTSRKRKVSAVKAEATRLHSLIVRSQRQWCEANYFPLPPGQSCGLRASDCAHIVGRVYSHTRTDENNAYALCGTHHRHFTNWQDDWLRFIDQTIGRDEYDRLKAKALAGVNVKFDWYDELDRLRAVAERIGLAS